MRQLIPLLGHILVIITLTLLTQIGGFAYLVALLVTRRWRSAACARWKRVGSVLAATVVLYATASFTLVPPLAALFDRVRAPCSSTTLVGCALNRTYLRPEALALVTRLDGALNDRFPGSRVTILEGSFPFFDEFPLPPHLSHHDGRKVDLAFFYREAATGRHIPQGSPSRIGYFHFQQPRPGDIAPCAGRFTPLRWGFGWLQPVEPDWTLDEERTRAMILSLKAHSRVTRIFIEPHLAQRLGVNGGKVRFQGCQAARHDDHLHVEVR